MTTDATHVANHMLESILRDLCFLKENKFIPNQAYNDVVSILPSRIQERTITLPSLPPTTAPAPTTTTTTTTTMMIESVKPPLPTRKSTRESPVPASRDVSSFPKLPTRRTNDWQPQPEQEKYTASPPPPAPPAYTQKPMIPETNILTSAEALYDYHGEDPSTDLSFKQGNIIEVTEYVNDDWWKGSVNGKSGIFPQNHVKKIAPSIKPKRPWVPPTSAKPSFSTSTPTTTPPYSYPPPPTAAIYQPPPPQTYNTSSSASSASYYQPAYNQPTYNQPPVAQPPVTTAVATEEEGGDKKVHNMAKKFGGHVATAATWGFGATLGSQAANAIF